MTYFAEPVISNLYKKIKKIHGDITPITPANPEQYFERLVESIVSQQLSVKVADIIFERLKKLIGSDFSPLRVLATDHESLRLVGLSNAKAIYIQNIAENWTNGTIQPSLLSSMTDEEVILHLVQIKGVGRWTAEMFLIFTLGRADIFSVGDYGLKKAISLAYNIPITSKPDEFLNLSNNWQPHRSLASRILWKSLDI